MGRTSGIRSPSCLWSRCGYLLRAREQGQAWDGGVGPGWRGAAPIHFRTVRDHHCLSSHPVTYCYWTTGWHPVYFCVCDPTETERDVWSWHSNSHARTLQVSAHFFLANIHTPYTDTLSSLQALLSKPTHRIVSGAALPSRLCVGGTEPQALSVSIAHVKSHVGCDEPPTIPGAITWRNRGRGSFRRPPWIAVWHRMPGLSSC